MDLRKILSQVLNEEAQIAGTQPAPTPSAKFYDLLQDYQNFERTINQQTEAAKKQLDATLTKNIGKKKVVLRASKGAVGQVEKDYTVDVKNISITHLNDEYYIVVTDSEGKEYYVNTAFKIKVLGDSTPSNAQEKQADQSAEKPMQSRGKGQIGGIVSPQNMGIAASGPNTLSSK